MKLTAIETKRLILIRLLPQEMTIIFEIYAKDEIMKILGHRNESEYEKEKWKQQNGYAAYNRSFIFF